MPLTGFHLSRFIQSHQDQKDSVEERGHWFEQRLLLFFGLCFTPDKRYDDTLETQVGLGTSNFSVPYDK